MSWQGNEAHCWGEINREQVACPTNLSLRIGGRPNLRTEHNAEMTLQPAFSPAMCSIATIMSVLAWSPRG